MFADLVPAGDPDIAVFIAITVAGFVIGSARHLLRSTPAIVAGIVLVSLGTLVPRCSCSAPGRASR